MLTKKSNYFNSSEYLDYLKKNFNLMDSSEERDTTCMRPDISLVLKYTDRLGIKAGENLLEIGCGLGRLLEFFSKHYHVNSSGVDISQDAIELAKETLPSLAQNLKCAQAEKLPFNDCAFNFVLCWAVFDLTQQGESLAEMLRVLKPGGALLLTGKNNLFMDDDEEALLAEGGSRKKGIPNHYTEYSLLRRAVELNGGEMELEHFFLRRGDFMAGKFTNELPEKFVEYCVVVRKKTHVPQVVLNIADSYSKSWRRLNG